MRLEDLCRPREEGGIGLCGNREVYDSISIKLWWKFRQQQSLWAEFMSRNYCAGLHPCLPEDSHWSSHTWRRMVAVQQVGEDHISWIVQQGSMDFWLDNWMGSGVLCNKVEIFHDHLVADFVDRGGWNVAMLNQYLDAALAR